MKNVKSKSLVTITPYGGLGEIGMNCMLIETESSAILIDCGLLFTELEHFGVEFAIPNFSHLLARKDKIKAVFATHAHEDHIGAMPFLFKTGIRAPLYCSHFTSLMLREKFREAGLLDAIDLNVLHSGATIKAGDMNITATSVNHSIIDAFSLFIDTPIGKIIHTGDFKLGVTSYFGDVMDTDIFKKAGDEGVLLLMSDSTNVEIDDIVAQEDTILPHLESLVERARGLVVVTLFSSNVGRLASIFKIAQKMGKKVAMSGRSMEQNLRLAQERGAIQLDAGMMIPVNELDRYDRNQVLLLTTGCQGEPRSALNRIAHGEHSSVELTEDDLVIFSSSQIPGNEKTISHLINELFKTGAEVVYNSVEEVHSTGHATRPELKKMLQWVKPKFFVPIHGEYRHLVHHAELAMEAGVSEENIAVIQNGESFELTPDSLEVVEEVQDLRIFVDGRQGEEVTKTILKDRRKIAETGVVFCLMTREKDSGRMLSKPELHGKGVIHESLEVPLFRDALEVVESRIRQYTKELKTGFTDPALAEDIRIELRRFFDRKTGKKPVVVPVILDV
jgi:ribonuclease J